MQLNSYAKLLITTFQKQHVERSGDSSSINPIVTELASWYEKFRNSIEYREEEMILRASIERILKRKLSLGGESKTVGKQLVRELLWAQYIPEEKSNEKNMQNITNSIDLYIRLKKGLENSTDLNNKKVSSFIYGILSADIENILSPSGERETIENYIFHVLGKKINIKDSSDEDKSVQLFSAIKKAYSKNDQALLEYHLFNQYFGPLTEDSFAKTLEDFSVGYKKINGYLNRSIRFKILNYVKRQIPPFLILEDILRQSPNSIELLENNEEAFNDLVISTCKKRYSRISEKVRRAIIRSIIFIALSKIFFAFAVEATYDSVFHGEIFWTPLVINILAPILIMVAISFLIKIPGGDNSQEILRRIRILLTDPSPSMGKSLNLSNKKEKSTLYVLFNVLWISGFVISIGAIVLLLKQFNFTLVSQAVFIFFLSIVSFLAYRINQTAQTYTVIQKQNFLTPLVDLFFMPIARVGRYLTEGISQINVFLFILDFIIETPYKGLVAFFEQWFFFLHSKRDDIA